MSFDERNANQIAEQSIDVVACRALWCAVLEEQVNLAILNRNTDNLAEVAAARRWFGSRDFYMVCALAGLDGAWVLGGIERLFAAERRAA